MYLQNKYTRWYYSIIQQAQIRTLPTDVYSEKHHIIPKSLGGNNGSDNLVKLTAREHFICHRLLSKMVTDVNKRKMTFAIWSMVNQDHSKQRLRHKVNSYTYEILRKQVSLASSQLNKGVPKPYKTWLGKKHSSDSKKLQSSVKQGDKNPMWGRQHNESTKLSMSITQKGISKPKFQCHKCGKIVGGKSNLERWHGDKCKQSSTH